MRRDIKISGFADEISSVFSEQLETVSKLGMEYISLRSANGKNISDFTVEEVENELLPVLKSFGIKVSSLGSPIGKIDIEDDEAFADQLNKLDRLCNICKCLNCRYIRIFSFFLPKGVDPDRFKGRVVDKLKQFVEIAHQYDVILIHENEKGIYGDSGKRCKTLFDEIDNVCFRAVFDFANFVQCGEDTEQCWKLLQQYISYIHIKDAVSNDNENVLCGTGEGKIAQLLTHAISEEGYGGFLTLEPHLVLFDSLQYLEKEDAADVIKQNKAANGAEGYAMQFHALNEILACIEN